MVRAMMFSLNFPELKRVNHQTNVAVPRKPNAVVMIPRLVSEAYPILFHHRMTADVQDRRRRLLL